MARTPTGTITSVATALTAAKVISAITNAAEAVVTCTAHGFANGDVVLVFSGWGRLNYRAFRIKSVTTDSFVLERCDTTNTTFYTPGGGGGTVQKASTWVDLDRTKNHSFSGGEPVPVEIKWVESDVRTSINDGFSAVTRTFEMDADAIGTPGYEAMRTLSAQQATTIVRRRAKTGAFTLIPGTVAFNEEEVESDGQPVVVRGTINGQNISTRYPATA